MNQLYNRSRALSVLYIAFMQFTFTHSTFAQDFFSSQNNWRYRFFLSQESNLQKLNDTPLNPNNQLVPQNRYGNFTSADLFLNWKTLTLNLKGASVFRELEKPDYDFTLRELYFDHALGNYFHLTIGRKLVKWGTGYAFNPTGVVEPRKDAADPSDRLNRYQGRQMVALDTYIGATSISIVYANEAVLQNSRIHWGADELAMRYYTLLQGVDLSFIGYWSNDDKARLGLNMAYTHGVHLELHGEFITQKGTNKLYHKIIDQDETHLTYHDYPYEKKYQTSNQQFYQVLLGAQYIFDSGISFMFEYLYNKEGLTQKEWNRWREFTIYHQNQIDLYPNNPDSYSNYYNALNTLSEEGTMRQYGFARLYIPGQKSGIEAITLINLIDGSGVFLPSFNYYANPNINFWIRYAHFVGSKFSEFGILFIQNSIRVGMRVYL